MVDKNPKKNLNHFDVRQNLTQRYKSGTHQ